MPEADGRLGPCSSKNEMPCCCSTQESSLLLAWATQWSQPCWQRCGRANPEEWALETDTITHLSCGGIREGEYPPRIHQCQSKVGELALTSKELKSCPCSPATAILGNTIEPTLWTGVRVSQPWDCEHRRAVPTTCVSCGGVGGMSPLLTSCPLTRCTIREMRSAPHLGSTAQVFHSQSWGWCSPNVMSKGQLTPLLMWHVAARVEERYPPPTSHSPHPEWIWKLFFIGLTILLESWWQNYLVNRRF